METYIHQNKISQYIATRPILDLCEAVERNRGERVRIRCWEQEGIDLEGERETTPEAEEADKDRMEE